MTVRFGLNVAAIEESGLFFPVDTSGDVSQSVLVGIHETVAGSNIAGRSDADQTKARATWMRFVHTLVEFGESVADVGKAVKFAA